MRRADREGHCRVYVRDGGGSYTLRRDHYAPILAAWKAGAAFYDGCGVFGSPITIKLALVEAIDDNSPDTIAEYTADEEQDRRERAITGEG